MSASAAAELETRIQNLESRTTRTERILEYEFDVGPFSPLALAFRFLGAFLAARARCGFGLNLLLEKNDGDFLLGALLYPQGCPAFIADFFYSPIFVARKFFPRLGGFALFALTTARRMMLADSLAIFIVSLFAVTQFTASVLSVAIVEILTNSLSPHAIWFAFALVLTAEDERAAGLPTFAACFVARYVAEKLKFEDRYAAPIESKYIRVVAVLVSLVVSVHFLAGIWPKPDFYDGLIVFRERNSR